MRIVVLPEPEDPDSYVKKVGTTAFEDYVKTRHNFNCIQIILICCRSEESNPIKKAELIKDIITTVAKSRMPYNGLSMSVLRAEKFGMSEQLLIIEVNKLRRKNQTTKPRRSIKVHHPTTASRVRVT